MAQIGGATLGLIAIFVVIGMLRGKKEATPSYMEQVTCKNCGWHGTVSRYARTCRGCNAKL